MTSTNPHLDQNPKTPVRVRFCPSPTGTPHVGLIRTALFNWAYARHTGGTFVFRIEDTDAARDSQESYEQLLDSMRWLGLTWDEGVEVGGPHGPYRQSERHDIYRDVIGRLKESGHIYESFSTPDEIKARHVAAGRNPQLGYDNADRHMTGEQRQAFIDAGRSPVWRLRMPDENITFTDLVRGELTFAADSVSDYVVVRANGEPLYTLVNPVDDALMRITHVLRGEDLLASTPRQIALYRALQDIGVADQVPQFGHLPYVMGKGNTKLSKRDPESNLFVHRQRGIIPEGMLNYLALLGWSIAPDRDIFAMDEMVAAFDIRDVIANPARFDQAKCDAINATHIRLLTESDFAARVENYLVAGGVLPDQPTPEQREVVRRAAPLIQTRVNVLSESVGMLGFFFTPDADLAIDQDALKQVTKDTDTSVRVLDATITTLENTTDSMWNADSLQTALRESLIDGLGVKPKVAFTPARVATSGRRVSPPLFESLEILGRESTLARCRALRTTLASGSQ